jgi:hypothetical protein
MSAGQTLVSAQGSPRRPKDVTDLRGDDGSTGPTPQSPQLPIGVFRLPP